ncbi:beta-1 adrenergic receptor-like [Diadema setosum]|uniref:beta-1 adrenergic receptor-like n=1 Tax=Diadema setosum TaxID=31175 RepID=UPI003B3BCCB6
MSYSQVYSAENFTTDNLVEDRSLVEIICGTVSMAAIILTSVCGNSLVLVAIWREKSLHSKTAAFIANLAIADLLNAMICMPTILASCAHGRWIFGNVACNVIGAFTTIVCTVSINTLGAISVDRFFCIVSPFRYSDRMSKRRIAAILTWIWVQSTLFSICPVIGWSRYIFISTEYMCTADWSTPVSYTLAVVVVNIVLPIIVMTYCYANIFRIASAHRKQINAQLKENRLTASTDALNGQGNGSGVNIAQRSKMAALTSRAKQLRKDTKAATTLLIVIGTFLLCWLPHSVTMLFIGFKVDNLLPDDVYVVSTWFAMLNSACNPFIYGITNKHFRDAFKRTLRFVLPAFCKVCVRAQVESELSMGATVSPSPARTCNARQLDARLHRPRRLSRESANSGQTVSDISEYCEKVPEQL